MHFVLLICSSVVMLYNVLFYNMCSVSVLMRLDPRKSRHLLMGIPNKIQFTWAPVNSSPSAESGRFRFPAVSWGLKKQRIVSHIGL